MSKGDGEGGSAYPKSVQAGIPKLSNPAGWPVVRIGDIFKVVQRPVDLQDDAEYQLVTAKRNRGGVVPRERLTGKAILTKSQFRIAAGDFLISRRQIAHGACGIVPKELAGAIVSNEYATLLPTDLLVPGFMRHLPESAYFQQTCFHSSIGVHVEKLVFNLANWLEWKITLPQSAEQKRIAAALDAWDDSIKITDAFVAARQREMAGLLRTLFSPAIDVTLVRLGWKRTEIGKLAKVVGGGTPATDNIKFWDGKIPWCTPTDLRLKNGRFLDSTERSITEIGLKNSAATILPTGSIVLCSRASVGECAINSVPMATNQGFQSLVPHDTGDQDFLLYMMIALKRRLVRVSAGSTFLEFGRNELRGLPVQVPEARERAKIGQGFADMDDEIRAAKKIAALLRRQKRGLMQKLLTGEWQVPDSIDRLMPGGDAAAALAREASAA